MWETSNILEYYIVYGKSARRCIIVINRRKFDLQSELMKWIDWSKGELIDILVTCPFCRHKYISVDCEPGEYRDCPSCKKGINDWSEETKLAVSQIVLQHLLSLEPSYKNLEHIINPEYDHDLFRSYVSDYKVLKKRFDDLKISLKTFIPLVPDHLYHRLTEIEVQISQTAEMLEEMVSFIRRDPKDLTDLVKSLLSKMERSVDILQSEVGF
jgi:Zn-finger nucleic acid-binding protein